MDKIKYIHNRKELKQALSSDTPDYIVVKNNILANHIKVIMKASWPVFYAAVVIAIGGVLYFPHLLIPHILFGGIVYLIAVLGPKTLISMRKEWKIYYGDLEGDVSKDDLVLAPAEGKTT